MPVATELRVKAAGVRSLAWDNDFSVIHTRRGTKAWYCGTDTLS